MDMIASQITSLTIVYSTVYSDADQKKYQSSASLAFVRVFYRRPVNSPHKWPVTRKMFPFDDVIMKYYIFKRLYKPLFLVYQCDTTANADLIMTNCTFAFTQRHIWRNKRYRRSAKKGLLLVTDVVLVIWCITERHITPLIYLDAIYGIMQCCDWIVMICPLLRCHFCIFCMRCFRVM